MRWRIDTFPIMVILIRSNYFTVLINFFDLKTPNARSAFSPYLFPYSYIDGFHLNETMSTIDGILH